MSPSDVMRRLAIVLVVFMLTACQTNKKPKQSVADHWLNDSELFEGQRARFQNYSEWKLTAKVGLKVDGDNDAATMVWHKTPGSDLVRLFGPLGAKAVKLELSASGALLTDDKGVEYRALTANTLLEEVTGWPIPVEYMKSWILGLPDSDAPANFTLDQARLNELHQGGWQVTYSYRPDNNSNGSELPRRLLAQSKVLGRDVELKVVIKSWKRQ